MTKGTKTNSTKIMKSTQKEQLGVSDRIVVSENRIFRRISGLYESINEKRVRVISHWRA
jgi:hypothetical protein